ncbi:MAG: GNAT family N-acetyltransferase [Tabrizicola sp.]|nr:GNAT family N-acetyltransferase [Tabrizicola sp.]
MIRRAGPGDEARLEVFLSCYPASSMFLRGNLAAHGLEDGESLHATSYHLWPAEGPIRAVLGLTRGGMVLCQFGAAPEAMSPLLVALRGQQVTGFSGDDAQTKALIAALGFTASDFRMNEAEPLFHLDLAQLQGGGDMIRPPNPGDLPLLADWLRTYLIETGLGLDSPGGTVEERAERAISAGQLRFLLREGQPVAMAAVNARAGTSVQVGGVFVPPAARNRGLGRAVTRALLAETRAKGTTEAVLFSNNEAASQAYRSIGFTEVGSYRIAFLHTPRVVGDVA